MANSASGLDEVQLPERYKLLRHLASGGMATVWCAHDRVLGRRVAIKLLAERFAGDEASGRRFQREARAAALLSSHPHVVTIFDVGETTEADGARSFIVMEYLAGGTVADALRVGVVRREDAVRWLREAAWAVDYAHRRGILHRDIKPANLLLDGDRTLHVADFGIARVGSEDTITSSREVVGTAAYLAPERALGQPATEASDRYSLAVAAFELLVGERPFTAAHFTAQARQHVEDNPPAASLRNPSVPAAVDGVLARGMAKRAGDRWPTAGAFADAVEAALDGAGAAAATPAGARAAAGSAAGARAAAGAAAGDTTASFTPRVRPGGPSRAPAGRRRPRRAVAVGALAAAAVGIGAAIAVSGDHGARHLRLATRVPQTVARAAAPALPRPKPKPKPPPPPAQTTATASATPAADTTRAPSADALEARGHALMESGQYGTAIPVLRQALGAAAPGSLTYAYALYDLGRSLRLAGDPQAAVPVLAQRMQIPNQTGVVRAELQQALLALGRLHGGAPGGTPPGPHGHGSGRPGHHLGHHSGGD